MNKARMFRTADGNNYALTFMLVSSLFLLWGFCNGMIDVMDKHFQEVLHLTLAQSATVQFAHYLGYFLMSLPAGMLATRLGYKGGIIAGLLMVAAGGLWFIPATKIAAFWAFLLGVGVIASGLTFLETVANPYTTVLGPKQFAATRINLAQSCNGVGWFFGPIAGGLFFYGKDAAGVSTGSQTLWIPYAAVAVVVIILAVAFYFASVPDLKTEDEYKLDDKQDQASEVGAADRQMNRPLVYFLLLANVVVLITIFSGIVGFVLSYSGLGQSLVGFASKLPHPWVVAVTTDNAVLVILVWAALLAIIIAAIKLVSLVKRTTHSNIWAHPHFSGATLAQFFYVAAQAGIFSFLINYMTSEPPPIPESWVSGVKNLAASFPQFMQGFFSGWFETNKAGVLCVSNKFASYLASFGFLCFLTGRVTGAMLLRKASAHLVVGAYAIVNILMCLLIVFKLGWLSVVCVFLSYLFMSIMFPTIFALGIFGLGVRAKKASAYIVMAIMGGAMLPKLMGAVADNYGMSRGFLVPMVCFVFIALYGFYWPKLSNVESLHVESTGGGH